MNTSIGVNIENNTFYENSEYAIDAEGRIFQKDLDGKHFFKDNPIIPELQRIFNYRAGSFRVSRDNLVLVKVGGRFLSLGILQEPLITIIPTKIKKNH